MVSSRLDRQAERDHGGHRSLARIGIDQGAGKFAEAIGGENFGRRRHRTIDPEFDLRAGAGFGAMSGTSKTKSEMLSLRPAGVSATRLPDRHGRGAAGHTRFQIGVAHRRHFVDRAQRHA